MAGFFRRGITEFHFLPAVADLAAPTRVEITAGENLSEFISEVSGWQLTNSPIPTPRLARRYTTQIPGEDTTEASTLTLDDDKDDTTVRDGLPKDEEGFILYMPYGDVPTDRCEVWPVTITGNNDTISMGNDPARYVVGFAITGVPNQDAVIPAA
jgi:hypothetical protein